MGELFKMQCNRCGNTIIDSSTDTLFCTQCREDWRLFCKKHGVEHIPLNDRDSALLLKAYLETKR